MESMGIFVLSVCFFAAWKSLYVISQSLDVDQPTCLITAGEYRDGSLKDVDAFLANTDLTAYTEGTIVNSGTFVLVLKLLSQDRYLSFIPTRCSLTATGATFMTSVDLINDTNVLHESLIYSKDCFLNARSEGPVEYHFGISNPFWFAPSSSNISIQCEFRLCIDVPSDVDACRLSADNRFGQCRNLTVPILKKDRSPDKSSITKEAPNGKPEIVPLPVPEDPSCMDRTAFISLTTGLGVLLLVLIIIDSVVGYQLWKTPKSKERQQIYRSSAVTQVQPARAPVRVVARSGVSPDALSHHTRPRTQRDSRLEMQQRSNMDSRREFRRPTSQAREHDVLY